MLYKKYFNVSNRWYAPALRESKMAIEDQGLYNRFLTCLGIVRTRIKELICELKDALRKACSAQT